MQGTPRCVFVSGAAGVGKTAVVEHFLQHLPAPAVSLRGRCHEREVLPFRTVDSLVDDLVRHLNAQDKSYVDSVTAELGAAANDLVRLFPVFGQLLQGIRASGCSLQIRFCKTATDHDFSVAFAEPPMPFRNDPAALCCVCCLLSFFLTPSLGTAAGPDESKASRLSRSVTSSSAPLR